MNIRVVRVITRLNIGGPSIQAITLSRRLTASGIETRLLHGELGQGEGDMTTLMPLDGVDAAYVPTLRRPISPIRDARALWRLFLEIRRFRPDIVHTHMAKAGALGRLAAVLYNWTSGRKHRVRLVHTYHGHVFEGYFGSPSTRVFLFVERWLGRRTETLVAISPQVRHDVIHTYAIGDEARTCLIPLGFDLERFLAIEDADRRRARAELAIPDEAIVVSTVGRLTAIKQHSLFFEMAAVLAANDPRMLFLVVGDGELRGALEAQVAALGIPSRVRFLGWRGDLERIYGATDVFVLTSRNEGTPVALIEAMASGVASVSTDVGGVRDVIVSSDAGTRVPFGDVAALVAAVGDFAASLARRRDVGNAARGTVRARFSLSRLSRDIEALYDRIVRQQ